VSRAADRAARLLPEGKPRYVHCYDDGGKSADRYTIVFTGRYRKVGESFLYIGANAYPFHPQGIGMHGESPTQIDWPTYGHLGKKIPFDKLPEDVQRMTLDTYRSIWGLDETPKAKPPTMEVSSHV